MKTFSTLLTGDCSPTILPPHLKRHAARYARFAADQLVVLRGERLATGLAYIK